VERRHRIGAPRQLQPQHGHAELFVRVGRVLAPHRHQIVEREAELIAQRPEVLLDEAFVETVVAGGDRRVRGEHHLARHARHGLVEPDAFLDHPRADGLEDGKAAVPFVEVQYRRRDAHRPQRLVAADAEQQFVTDAHAGVAAVQTRREVAVLGRVAFDVRVEQQQVAAAHLHAPHLGGDDAAARLELHGDRFAVLADGGLHRHQVGVRAQVLFPLPAVAVETLPEVALTVEQPDADERQAEVRGALDVVPGQHAQAARVDRKRLVQAELGEK
jgi:hypothetical protein